jgi:hypothetical protein
MKVYAAINAVQGELAQSGISKDRKNAQQGYSFRGIDDVYNALAPLLAKHGLCVLPRILTRQCEERVTQKGGTLFYVTVEAEFDFVSSEDGSSHVVRTFGEAMDSGDKATNKAMSAAYKYAAFQAFAIPTEGDNDADSHTYTPAPGLSATGKVSPTDGVWDSLSEEAQDFLQKAADWCIGLVAEGRTEEAASYIRNENINGEELAGLWTRMDSKVRTPLKKALEGK